MPSMPEKLSKKASTGISKLTEVPLLDLKAQYTPIRLEILAGIDRVFDSQHFILGPEVEELEKAEAGR